MSAMPTVEADRRDAHALVVDLHRRYGDQIRRFCRRRLGDREEAEDAAQLTFINAFRSLERGASLEFESAWLFRIAENVCLNSKRATFRRRRIETPVVLEEHRGARQAAAADQVVLLGVVEALRELPDLQRRAILLREWQGLSYKEIAAELELSDAAVETLLFRARCMLAENLRQGRRGRLRLAHSGIGSVFTAFKGLLVGSAPKLVGGAAAIVAAATVAASPELAAPAKEPRSTVHAEAGPAVHAHPALGRTGIRLAGGGEFPRSSPDGAGARNGASGSPAAPSRRDAVSRASGLPPAATAEATATPGTAAGVDEPRAPAPTGEGTPLRTAATVAAAPPAPAGAAPPAPAAAAPPAPAAAAPSAPAAAAPPAPAVALTAASLPAAASVEAAAPAPASAAASAPAAPTDDASDRGRERSDERGPKHSRPGPLAGGPGAGAAGGGGGRPDAARPPQHAGGAAPAAPPGLAVADAARSSAPSPVSTREPAAQQPIQPPAATRPDESEGSRGTPASARPADAAPQRPDPPRDRDGAVSVGPGGIAAGTAAVVAVESPAAGEARDGDRGRGSPGQSASEGASARSANAR